MVHELAVRASDGETFTAPLWLTDVTRAPAVVIMPPIFGIDEQMRDLALRCTRRGYVATALNQFWRDAQPQTFARSPEDRPLAMARAQRVDVRQVTADAGAAVAALRARPECNGTIFVMGYCFGGRYAFLAAAQLDVDAAAAFHPTQIGLSLAAAPAVHVPLQLHFGGEDPLTPPEEIAAIHAALAHRGDVEIDVHPGVGHNFSQPGWPGYDAEAASRSEAAAFALFDRIAAREARGGATRAP